MAAKQKVGPCVATLVFFLVVEAQRRVNVNVHLNITNSGSGTGHIEGYRSKGPTDDVIKPQEMIHLGPSSPRLTDEMLEKERLRTTWEQNLPPRARARGEIRSGINQEQEKEDCGAFFIVDCANKTNSPRDTILVPARDQETCQKSCVESTLLDYCKSFLWRADETSGRFKCFNSRKSMKNLVLDQCNTFYGKVLGEDEHALDSCINGKAGGQCRPGDCNDVVSHLGDEIPTALRTPIKTENEIECKKACFSMGVCKYYTWDQITLICKPYKGASSTVSATVTCHARAGNKKSECTKGCQYISEWSEWSQCSYKCETQGTQVRTRTKVENGNDCPTSETQPCQYECAPCPDGWIPDKEGKFGCFHFGNEDQLMNWNDAKEFCSGLQESSKLVESCSKDMNDAIAAIIPYEPPKSHYTGVGWIGVYRDAYDEPWKWASTGSALTPEDFDWREGEPGGYFEKEENCVEMHKRATRSGRAGKWNNRRCEVEPRYPICHYPCNATELVRRNHFYPEFPGGSINRA